MLLNYYRRQDNKQSLIIFSNRSSVPLDITRNLEDLLLIGRASRSTLTL